jgi:hypothetical protein
MSGPTRTFRDRIRMVCPSWLQHGWAEKLMYAFGTQIDVFADALVAGVKLRFPNYYSAESLPLIGRERRISRGLLESDAVYADRLTRWFDDHRRRGGPYAMLAQLHAYYQPNTFPIQLVYRSGRRYSMDPDGNVTREDISFHPDNAPEQWARWWLVMEADAYTPPLSAQDIADIALIPTEWNAAHCTGTVIVMPTGGELWDYPVGHVWDEPGVWNTADVVSTVQVY